MAKKQFPQYAECISMTLTPMVLTARMIKKQHPDARVVFIGPCAAKKLEASRKSVRSEVDFVLTFEEMAGIFDAKEIDPNTVDPEESRNESSADGKGFAVQGGVARAVVNVIKEKNPEIEVNVASAQGLDECRRMMMLAKAGKYNGYLLEGMACPGGCMGGAGVISDVVKASASLEADKNRTEKKRSTETEFGSYLELITRE